MFATFRNSGAPGELTIAPPYKQDGHSLIFGQPMWRDAVYDFLKRNGLPSAAPVLPPPGGAEVAQAFAKYVATPNYEKAFVIGSKGYYGWASGHATQEEALRAARSECGNHCGTVYALDDTLAAGGSAPVAQAPSSPVTPRPAAGTPEGGATKSMDGRLQQRLGPGSTAP
jgi:hypothetical protein